MKLLVFLNRHPLFLGGISFFILIFAAHSAMHCDSSGAKANAASLPAGQQEGRARSLKEVTESTTSLGLEGSYLYPVEPFSVQKDEQETFIRETVAVQWRPDDLIYLYLVLPKGVKNPPVVLYLYSYPSELDRFRNDRLCQSMTAGGVAAVGFCSALTGHRYKNRPMKEWFVSELQEAIVLTIHDVQMILNYLDNRGDLDTTRIGFWGQGSGGTIALLAAAMNKSIKAVQVINPWGNWPEWMSESSMVPNEEKENFTQPTFLSHINQLDPVEVLPKLRDKPGRLDLILSDPITPDACLQRIAKSAPDWVVVDIFADSRAHADSLKNGTPFDWIKITTKNLGSKSQESAGLNK